MDAWKMIGVILRSKQTQAPPNRVYACPRGHGWHMSSKPKK